MLTTLKTSYTDTRAQDLAWRLGMDPMPALAVLDLRLGSADVQLRLLGASHQVLLSDGDSACSETVACLPGSNTPLPLGVAKQVAGWEYEFAARVETLTRGPSNPARRSCWRWSPTTRAGSPATFPGSPHALTALLVHRQGDVVGWRTWHSYPQEGRLVATRTTMAARVAEPV